MLIIPNLLIFMDSITLINEINPLVKKFIVLIVWILLIWLLKRFLQSFIGKKVSDKDNRYRTQKFISFAGYFFIVVLITIIFSKNLGGISVALGVAGAGIAFALQEVITSFAGWLAIIFGGFYETGDRVQLGGIKGDVIDIGVLRTTLMEIGQWVDADLYNGRIVRIANSFIFKEPVFNYSGDFPFLWDEIKIPIQYDSNYDKVRAILLMAAEETVGDYSKSAKDKWSEMVNKYLIEDASTEPMVTLIANDNWVEFTLRYVVDFKKRRKTKDLLFTKILSEVSASNGEIKFASTTFHLVEAPEFKVKIES